MKTLTRKTVSVLLASALLMSGGAAASAKESTSAAVSVSASAQVAAPAQVVNVKEKSVDETSAKLTWDKVNGAKG